MCNILYVLYKLEPNYHRKAAAQSLSFLRPQISAAASATAPAPQKAASGADSPALMLPVFSFVIAAETVVLIALLADSVPEVCSCGEVTEAEVSLC